MEGIGLALLYPAREQSVCALATMDIRAHPISFSARPWKARRVTRSRMRRRDRFSIFSIQLADLSSPVEIVRCHTSLDPNQAWRYIREPGSNPATSKLLSQNDRSMLRQTGAGLAARRCEDD
jgi:hypothetical protein